MSPRASRRIAEFVDALPLSEGVRVLEIGCGPGVAAREVSQRQGVAFVLAIDRSEKAIALAVKRSAVELATGKLEFRRARIEDFRLRPGEEGFDLAFALRVGALDGRHPEAERQALSRIKAAMKPDGRLFVDGGAPLREVPL